MPSYTDYPKLTEPKTIARIYITERHYVRGLGLQRPAIGVISIAAAFLSAVALNHQSAEDVFAYSQDSNSNHNKGQ